MNIAMGFILVFLRGKENRFKGRNLALAIEKIQEKNNIAIAKDNVMGYKKLTRVVKR